MDAYKPILSPAETADYAVAAALAKAKSPAARTFLLALTGGTFIGIGFIFYLVSQQGADKMPLGMAKVVGGIVFSSGLALVVLTGAELFTSTTLLLTAKVTGELGWGRLLRNWLIVYVGNIIGALALATAMFLGGSFESAKGALGVVALTTAEAKVSHTLVQTFFLGVLCNLMVCLAIWVSYAGRSLMDKVAAVTLPIAMFVAAGFEHSVANMFLLPYAMAIKTFAPHEFWAVAGTAPGAFPHLTWANVVLANILPVTLGNIVGGGILIGVFYTVVHKKIGRPRPAA